jgi:ferredoxin
MDCAHCYIIAPNTFALNKTMMVAHVTAQPNSLTDLAKAYEAMAYCPVEAINVKDSGGSPLD